ncbi:GTP 3',8-cyclase MoaA [Helicobacter pametensis]|uniref:GTP 3',8-cyclase MoaA n=1 Tax=Helicobacter pametensis TaxID=95149 RepID=UPI00047F6CD0|nr:GTP 3',8-cyclase MoaA [Helicobacter pametensis]
MLIDSFDRKIEYLRISVTKQCNFRCQYCMPDTPENFLDKDSLIPLDKMFEFVKVAIDEGIKKIRITGGEPLLREDLSSFIASIRSYAPSIELALTTNGYFLKKYAKSLKESGLDRLNISLDSLKPSRVVVISKRDVLPQILEGIDEAQRVGFPIKLNMVPLKGINDDEIIPMLEYASQRNMTLRYIEFMENHHANSKLRGLNEAEILQIISQKYKILEIPKQTLGPSKSFKLAENNAIFGIIAPHNDDFCKSCNRIRLTSEGTICPCLYYQEAVDAKEGILEGDLAKMRESIRLSVKNKPEKNQWDLDQNEHSARAFYYTGG